MRVSELKRALAEYERQRLKVLTSENIRITLLREFINLVAPAINGVDVNFDDPQQKGQHYRCTLMQR